MNRFSSWAQRNMPTREQMAGNRFIRPFAGRVLRSELWRFTRRSVPRGVALGLLVGIIVPFAQILFAALLSAPVRANVPLAALTTFVTNPFTTPLIWVAAYWVGSGCCGSTRRRWSRRSTRRSSRPSCSSSSNG